MVAYVHQDPRIGTCEAFTVEENLAFASRRGQMRGLAPAINDKLRQQFRVLLKKFNLDLESKLTTLVSNLSGGQRQALSLIMATLPLPKILLLDEHTAALDPKTASTILAMTKHLVNEYRLTTFMVTHNLHHALALGNRTLLMQEGKIIQDLTAEQRNKLTPTALLNYF